MSVMFELSIGGQIARTEAEFEGVLEKGTRPKIQARNRPHAPLETSDVRILLLILLYGPDIVT